ncbi:acetylglutamate kinase [Candidatus Roizmanbacteria bacterium RIFCSPHIGHO2_01_FULL_39_12c]|uniref:Acetylglutamate kinase n=1 Tax=Candidatus Roizmanbacteria bacterium RIFCSPHIGHO2_01_FULL_39_12c TaxID=1802031 RepID=A0A1F7GE19_9BACT|nr:MAG: acetylglutamate kinase [Candidatus Roizmanbacteria bacterium RIFCSPHIGHO2_01_FULL_39_12c]OGK46886.1 MAG: acetylglutamate kinase [Candidatus Roizmanbacteria bacterium RIFCSPLOWO2_01_FULL_40_13]
MLILKVGGGKSINWDFIAQDLISIQKKEKLIIVHGASVKRDEIANKLGHPTKVITSASGIDSVYTDDVALDIFLMVYSGLVNKKIVALLQKYGLNALGLSGVDGKLWEAKAKKDLLVKEGKKIILIRDNKTGRVEKINTKLINILLKSNYIPVISAPALSYAGEIVNTDNDWAAAVMAGTLKSQFLVYLFEAPGMLEDFSDPGTLIKKISQEKFINYLQYAKSRMKKKLLAVKKALDLGVEKIYFGDGRIKNPVVSALKGNGTTFTR